MTRGYGWWTDAEDGAILLSSNQSPYDWWTGYHEDLYEEGALQKKEDWQSGVVRPYTSQRMISFLDWMKESDKYSIDTSRTFVAGTSMGGSGALMMAIRYPEYFSWARSWVGVHIPLESPNFKSSYQKVYGKPEYQVNFEDGTPVWDYYDDTWYLRNHISDDIGFLTFSNGKNDNGIGWEQAVKFYEALQETRQPHLFVWGQSGHAERSVMPMTNGERVMEMDINMNQPIPAFTNCSLDNNIGMGSMETGEDIGQINKYLYWQTKDIVDTEDTFEMTLCLMDIAPKDACTVTFTPRRVQNFKVEAGDTISYKNIDVSTGKVIDEGTVLVDKYGLITIENQRVSKTYNRIIFSKIKHKSFN